MGKRVKTVLSRVLWTVVLLYLGVTVLLHVPFFQRMTGDAVASALSQKLGTRVDVGRVDLGFLNRIIIDDVLVFDQRQQKMLQATRLSAKVDVVALLDGQVRISSVQLFGLNAHLYRPHGLAQTNFQFVVDSLASKSNEPSAPLDVEIQSFILRNGQMSWDDYNRAPTPGRLNTAHLSVSDVSTHITLNTLTNDSLSARVRRLSLREASGLDLRSLSLVLTAGRTRAAIRELKAQLPNSLVDVEEATAAYQMKDGKLDSHSLTFRLKTRTIRVAPTDLAFLDPALKAVNGRYSLRMEVEGSPSDVRVSRLELEDDDQSVLLKAKGRLSGIGSTLAWTADVNRLKISKAGIDAWSGLLQRKRVALPNLLTNLGAIDFKGKGQGRGRNVSVDGQLLSDAGNADMKVALADGRFNLSLKTPSFNIGRLLDNDKLGVLACHLDANGTMPRGSDFAVKAKGEVERFDYNGYSYQNIAVDGSFDHDLFIGRLSMDDPNGRFSLEGRVQNILAYIADHRKAVDADLKLVVEHFNPQRLRLTDALGDRTFALNGDIDLHGGSLNDLNGVVDIRDFSAVGEGSADRIGSLQVAFNNNSLLRSVSLVSDYGDAEVKGQYSYETLVQSLCNVVGDKLPSLRLGRAVALRTNNRFDFALHLRDASPLGRFLHLPLQTPQPITASGAVDERSGLLDLSLDAPSLIYKGTRVDNLALSLHSDVDSLQARLQGERISDSGQPFSVQAALTAADDEVQVHSLWDAHATKPTHGTVNATARLFRESGALGASVDFAPSEAVFDTVRLAVQPSHVTYAKNRLTIDRFEVSNGSQHVIVNGQTTGQENDSLTVDLQNINVAYVLDLVNFHSVDFGGLASGTAYVKSLFHKPSAQARLTVEDFTFQDGPMGTLRANLAYDGAKLDIDAVADDGPEAQTLVGGYVSIKDNYIDLPITAHGTRLKFLESFCGSFMDNVEAQGQGTLRVFGDLKDVNLEGDLRASGTFDVTPLRTSYEMRNAAIHVIPDHIQLVNDTVYDKYGHIGIVSGELSHESLRNLTYDIRVDAQKLLAYDHKTYGDNTFYGTVFGTGYCTIQGKSGELLMDVVAEPEKGSFIEYNASYAGDAEEAEYIRWGTRRKEEPKMDGENDHVADSTDVAEDGAHAGLSEETADVRAAMPIRPLLPSRADEAPDIPTDMHINFLVNTNPNFTLRVLMDEASGDYIALNGNGVIRATYFNKGAFQMFGNYNVEHGIYKLTIQNVIKKEFQFMPGSTIAFGGDPYSAALNLKGVYTVNGASLSDLQLGSSFTRNNVRVNCLMDIQGTPEQPTVEFGLDLPTLSSDAQAMVRSVINSQEDMNQQVLYLLAVGRFYPQGNNNSGQDATQNQTSLAMQSLLSGTISQQINTVLSNVVKSNDWNFGANISTGDEGFSNAEYEGLLSGRMLNNRLLFNGQFGYRDNVTTNTSSFIGDFDLRYLLTPSGSFAVRVYNQNNDRYFTRNSLNTQGLGLILKKDFSGLKDLFQWKKRKGKGKGKEKQKK